MDIQIRKTGNDPSFARIIIADPKWERDFSQSQKILTKVCENWPKDNRVQFILTSSGFIDFDWVEPENKILDNWYPDSNYVTTLRSLAEERCKSLINDELRAKLNSCADYLSIGIDSEKYNKLSHPDCWPFHSHIEFVALIDLKNNRYHWTGKSYPQGEQARGLIRNQDISNHFIDLPFGKILVLACHDLVMEYPRGKKATKPHTPRYKIRTEFEAFLHAEKPTIVLHHAHTSNDSLIWRTSLNNLQTVESSVLKFISTGIFSALCGDDAGIRLKKILEKTTNDDTLDFIVTSEQVSVTLPKIILRTPGNTKKHQQKAFPSPLMHSNLMNKQLSSDDYGIFKKIKHWSEDRQLKPYWSPAGSFYPMYKDIKSDENNLISIIPNGTVRIQLKYIFLKSPFNNPEKKIALIGKLNSIPGIHIKENQLDGLPSIPLNLLSNPVTLTAFLELLDWILAEVKKNPNENLKLNE